MTLLERYAAVKIGACIRVLRPFTGRDGAGRPTFHSDGYEGLWYVVGKLGPLDFELAKHPDADYQVICHASRIAETTQYTDHPDYPVPANASV